MIHLKRLVGLLIFMVTMNISLMAYECCPKPPACKRLYVGVFGGGIYSSSIRGQQQGTGFFSEVSDIGPLAIIAKGHFDKSSSGFGGVQLGYEWSRPCSSWSIATAGELEAFFFSQNKDGILINENLAGLEEHIFDDSFRMHSSVILANLVLSVNNQCLCGVTPYIGGGLGWIRMFLDDADSFQLSPNEGGINHFNSDTEDVSWTFAAQVKAGLRYKICGQFHIFGEYRFLYVDNSRFLFGAANFPEDVHVPTSPFNIKLSNFHYNAFAIGIQFDL